MSSHTAAHGCRLLEWDTRFFGRRIARCSPRPDAIPDRDDLAAWCREQAVDCLYLLCPAADAALARFAAENHFQLVDIRLTLERPLAVAPPAPEPAPAVLRPASTADLPALQALARMSHRNTRFFRDGRFPSGLCEKFYETWIANSLADPATSVWLAEVGGRTAGYVTAEGRGQIGLLAVDAAYRRLGLGRQLVRQALALLRERGLATAQVVTQGGCVGPQRLYQQCGFLTAEVGLWYHKWFT